MGANFFGEGVHALQITHARFFFSAIILCFIWYFVRPEVKPTRLKLHFLRSLCGWVGVAIFFTAILFIPVSDATALTFLNPIFAMFFAFIISGGFLNSPGLLKTKYYEPIFFLSNPLKADGGVLTLSEVLKNENKGKSGKTAMDKTLGGGGWLENAMKNELNKKEEIRSITSPINICPARVSLKY